eukprot:6114350-Pyramimonas_sp.AAC.1
MEKKDKRGTEAGSRAAGSGGIPIISLLPPPDSKTKNSAVKCNKEKQNAEVLLFGSRQMFATASNGKLFSSLTEKSAQGQINKFGTALGPAKTQEQKKNLALLHDVVVCHKDAKCGAR